ncbi:hypothetical protein CBR_g19262 [Chara braunii]|uniref:Reverse transcriptase domain-containing protein n=1 Tax=Chara braunii TaxID=69332 RepID=A0A388JTP6_CHABU|nr:hypothetical protein CBR_g19262 [Chara braunii]|eukprot:GBG61186.1 hypothetical protein CBR_g19262 [Chara braunii]
MINLRLEERRLGEEEFEGFIPKFAYAIGAAAGRVPEGSTSENQQIQQPASTGALPVTYTVSGSGGSAIRTSDVQMHLPVTYTVSGSGGSAIRTSDVQMHPGSPKYEHISANAVRLKHQRKLFTVGSGNAGKGAVLFCWNPKGSCLAIAGPQRKVSLYNRGGRLWDEIILPQVDSVQQADDHGEPMASCCLALEWDMGGDKLAILQRGSMAIMLYAIATKERMKIDCNMKSQCEWTKWKESLFMVKDAQGNDLHVLLDEKRESLVTFLNAMQFCKKWRKHKEEEQLYVAFVRPTHVPSTFAANIATTLIDDRTSGTSISNTSIPLPYNSPNDPTSDSVVSIRDLRPDFGDPFADSPPPLVPSDIQALLDRFPEVLAEPGGVPMRPVRHTIELVEGAIPPKGCVYRMGPGELEELRRQIDEMIDKGWIKPSESEFAARVLFVPKKGGKLRMCIDYRGLNVITRKNAYPLPRIDDLLDAVGGCKVFSKIDLKSGYHQIEVDPADQHKTAFKTRDGLYEFIVMPFGLTNAPVTFQSLMDKVLREQIGRFVVVYLDDILIFSKSMEEHLKHLEEVLAILKKTQLHLNLEKSEFGKDSVIYLGHRLSAAGLEPEATKIEVMRDLPQPANIRELRSFLGLASYCRKFVPRFSIIARPLSRLTSKNVPYSWGPRVRKLFELSRKPWAVFMEIVAACAAHVEKKVTHYNMPLPVEQVIAFALFRWASVVRGDVRERHVSVRHRQGHWSAGRARCNFDAVEGVPRLDQVACGAETCANIARFSGEGFPELFGEIDCTHVYIDKPADALSDNYYDRKQKFSIQAQVVGDLDLHILDVHQFVVVCTLQNILLDSGIEFDENLLWEVDDNGVRCRVDLDIVGNGFGGQQRSANVDEDLLLDALRDRLALIGVQVIVQQSVIDDDKCPGVVCRH